MQKAPVDSGSCRTKLLHKTDDCCGLRMDSGIDNPEDTTSVRAEFKGLNLPLDTVESVRGQETTDTNLSGLSGSNGIREGVDIIPKGPGTHKPIRTVQALVRHSRYLSKLRESEQKQKKPTAP